MADKATVTEVNEKFSLKDLAGLHQMLDVQEEADAHYREREEMKRKSKGGR